MAYYDFILIISNFFKNVISSSISVYSYQFNLFILTTDSEFTNSSTTTLDSENILIKNLTAIINFMKQSF